MFAVINQNNSLYSDISIEKIPAMKLSWIVSNSDFTTSLMEYE